MKLNILYTNADSFLNKELEINRGENILGSKVHTRVASGRLLGGKDSADEEVKGVKSWKCFKANASLVSLHKKAELELYIEAEKPDIIGFTETWAKSDIGDGEMA